MKAVLKYFSTIIIICSMMLSVAISPIYGGIYAEGSSYDVSLENDDSVVAIVGSVGYSSLEDALKNANGTDINLVKDISVTSPISVSLGDESINLHLNGHKITVSENNQQAFKVSRIKEKICGVFRIFDDGESDSKIDGTIYLDKDATLCVDKGIFEWNEISYDKTNYAPCVYTISDSYTNAAQGTENVTGYGIEVRNEEGHLYWGSIYKAQNIYFDSSIDAEYLKTILGISDKVEQWAYKATFHDITPDGEENLTYGYILYLKKGESFSNAISRQDEYIKNNLSQYEDELRIFSQPAYDGYAFDGWYNAEIVRDENWNMTSIKYKNSIDLDSAATGDIVLYSKWKATIIGIDAIFGDNILVKRYFGDTRYDTAIQAADALKTSMSVKKFDSIIVACGDDYADALSGSYLAKIKNAPILIVNKNTETKIKAYISENLASNGTVYILGGSGAVSERFENSLKGYNVKRIGGSDRFETNLLVLQEANVTNEDILICSAYGYADSLSASATGKPIMLVGNNLTNSQKSYLSSLKSKCYKIIGGTGAVNTAIRKELSNYGNVNRIYGQNRYETSIAVAKEFFLNGSKAAVVVYGLDFPDGLCGGQIAISIGSPLILADENNLSYIKSYAKEAGLEKIVVLGGTALISDKAINEILR